MTSWQTSTHSQKQALYVSEGLKIRIKELKIIYQLFYCCLKCFEIIKRGIWSICGMTDRSVNKGEGKKGCLLFLRSMFSRFDGVCALLSVSVSVGQYFGPRGTPAVSPLSLTPSAFSALSSRSRHGFRQTLQHPPQATGGP